LHNVRVELTSENDLFFHYTITYLSCLVKYYFRVDEDFFRQIQDQQKLTIEFPELSQVIVKMLNSCIKEPHSFLAVFVMQKDGRATLDFI
jgi:hypothetical protein